MKDEKSFVELSKPSIKNELEETDVKIEFENTNWPINK